MKSTHKHGKAAGIRDIAEALGTSIGTVDRALHDRSGVSARTKARVLRMAEQLGYKPNIAARTLKLNRNIRIAAVFPREIAAFFDPLRGDIQAAADEAVGLQLTLDFINGSENRIFCAILPPILNSTTWSRLCPPPPPSNPPTFTPKPWPSIWRLPPMGRLPRLEPVRKWPDGF